MRIIKIEQQENGSHFNQEKPNAKFKNIPEGWAVIPDELVTENYPFGDITVEEIDGVMTVTNWTPREIPEPSPEPESPTLDIDDFANAILEGVNEV